MEKVKEILFANSDSKYAAFQAKLTPGIDPDSFIGVRLPALRKIASEFYKDAAHYEFMKELPHRYYDENMLHGCLISLEKDYVKCIEELEMFLPYVDNWAVCDTMSPKVFRKHRAELLEKIYEWTGSDKTYTIRFGIEMLMSHFLDKDYRPEFLEIPASILSDEYYVNMMIAWYFATALAKQWESTIPYITEGRLGKWVNNKTIQKARESFRITDEQKEYLKQFRK